MRIYNLFESTIWSCCEHVCDFIHSQMVIIACGDHIFSGRREKGTREALRVNQITNRIRRFLIEIPSIPNLHFTVKLLTWYTKTSGKALSNFSVTYKEKQLLLNTIKSARSMGKKLKKKTPNTSVFIRGGQKAATVMWLAKLPAKYNI